MHNFQPYLSGDLARPEKTVTSNYACRILSQMRINCIAFRLFSNDSRPL